MGMEASNRRLGKDSKQQTQYMYLSMIMYRPRKARAANTVVTTKSGPVPISCGIVIVYIATTPMMQPQSQRMVMPTQICPLIVVMIDSRSLGGVRPGFALKYDRSVSGVLE
jgi:hypothetical protein